MKNTCCQAELKLRSKNFIFGRSSSLAELKIDLFMFVSKIKWAVNVLKEWQFIQGRYDSGGQFKDYRSEQDVAF